MSIEIFLERWAYGAPERIPITTDRVRLGRGEENDVVLVGDESVSRAHAVLEATSSGWTLTDLDSHNGTFLNGQRVASATPCLAGDELRLGRTRLIFGQAGRRAATTKGYDPGPAPVVTPRQRELLIELCRPVLAGSALDEPPTVPDLASALFVSESAVKKHLGRLYDLFDLHDAKERRRGYLAVEAIRRGAVTRRDVVTASD